MPNRTLTPLVGALLLATLFLSIPPAHAEGAPNLPDGWGPAAVVEDGNVATSGSPGPISTAIAPDGHILTTFLYSIPVIGAAYGFSMYTPGQGWGPTGFQFVQTPITGRSVAIALPNNSFMMAWSLTSGTPEGQVWASMWTPSVGWMAPSRVDTASASTETAWLAGAADPSGNVLLVWAQRASGHLDLVANRYAVGSGWGTSPTTIDSSTDDINSYDIEIGVDAGGNAVVCWLQNDGTTDRAYASRFVAGSSWGSATPIDSGSSLVGWVSVAVDPSGEAVATIAQSNGARLIIYANTMDDTGTWAGAQPLSPDSGSDANRPVVSSNGQGQFGASWTRYTASGSETFGATYTALAGWTSPATIPPSSSLSTGSVDVAVGADGAVLAALYIADSPPGQYHGFLVQWDQGVGWSAAMRPDDSNLNTFIADLACGPDGTCVVLWIQNLNGADHVWASVYTPPDRTPPDLQVGTPSDGATVGNSSVVVSGTAEPGATVVVSGVVAAVDSGGAFSVRVALAEGANTVSVTATDASGNEAVDARTVTYTPSGPGTSPLDGQVAALGQELSSARGELNATRTDLTAYRAAANATAAAHASLSEQVAALGGAGGGATQEQVDAANAAASSAMLVGLVGVLVAAAALGRTWMMGRRVEGGGQGGGRPTAESPSPPNPSSGEGGAGDGGPPDGRVG